MLISLPLTNGGSRQYTERPGHIKLAGGLRSGGCRAPKCKRRSRRVTTEARPISARTLHSAL